MSFVCFTPYILGYIASFFNYFFAISTLDSHYQLTENKGKQNMNSLMKGFNQRWAYMRKLLALTNTPISDEDFDSLNVSFNIAKPVDTKNDMENMKMQYEMGAISKRTIIERSPYTSDSAQELQRLAAEGVSIEGE